MKTILGLDLGTNSIGWALIQQDFQNKTGKILGMGSRIIPMSQDIMGKFDNGVSISQTADRTGFRGVRRLRERHLLRRERLHRILNIIDFLPKHYAKHISFTQRQGQFEPEAEPKLPYQPVWNEAKGKNEFEFIFKNSFNEMMADFAIHQPQLLLNKKGEPALVPYDWTIYYLRKKALSQRIEKEELAWLLLNFNQKRGYYQLRGEEEDEPSNKTISFHPLKVIDVTDSGDRKGKDEIWYNVYLENGWIYRRTSKVPLDWVGKIKEFIVTTDERRWLCKNRQRRQREKNFSSSCGR
jgi:CRISPR-associated endonuclease Csn1